MLSSIKRAIEEMKVFNTNFKNEYHKIPKHREAEYKSKYSDYSRKIREYEKQIMVLELTIKDDKAGLLAIE